MCIRDRYQAEHPDAVWIIGRGWAQNDWPVKDFPTKDILDKAFPNNPVYLTRIDGHAGWVNSKALQLAKITAETKAEGGLVVLKNGQPTGVLIDRAQQLVRALNPTPTKEDITSKLLKAQAMCFQYGLTNVGDAGLSPDIIDHIDSLSLIHI